MEVKTTSAEDVKTPTCHICGKKRKKGITLHKKWICQKCLVACSIIVKCGQIETYKGAEARNCMVT